MLDADVDIEEIESKAGYVTIFAPPGEFFKAKTALLQAFPGVELEVQEITFLRTARPLVRKICPCSKSSSIC